MVLSPFLEGTLAGEHHAMNGQVAQETYRDVGGAVFDGDGLRGDNPSRFAFFGHADALRHKLVAPYNGIDTTDDGLNGRWNPA